MTAYSESEAEISLVEMAQSSFSLMPEKNWFGLKCLAVIESGTK